MRILFNSMNVRLWSQIRDFLAIHYRFNDRLDTGFWRRCREEIPLHGLEGLVEFYRENGPSSINAGHLLPGDPFGLEGYLAMLAGLKVPHQRPYAAPPAETNYWKARCERHRKIAQGAMGMPEVQRHLLDRGVWDRLRSR
jgi:tryptophan halogenase